MLKWLALASTALAFFTASGAQAATLTGDTITQTDPTGTFSFLVTSPPGVQHTEGHTTFEYNGGVAGNEFLMDLIAIGSFTGVYSTNPVTSTITLSNLNFSGGEALTGFTVLNSVLGPITVDILSSTSLSLSWTDGAPITGPEVMLSGDFLTTPVTSTPLPAALPLLATGLGGLGLLGWRRKRKAQAV
jgi:hypothetical protein